MTLPGEFTIRQYRQYSASTSTLDLHHHLYSACLLRVPCSAFRVLRSVFTPRVFTPRSFDFNRERGQNLRRAPCFSGASIGFTALICVIVLQGLTNCRTHWYYVTLLERLSNHDPLDISRYLILRSISLASPPLLNFNKAPTTVKGIVDDFCRMIASC